ncbi:MAG: hypothetical protein EPO10_01930, partial [Reyranella sp.]
MRFARPFGVMSRVATQMIVVLILSSLLAWIGIGSLFVTLAPESILFLSPTVTRHVVSVFNVLHGLEALPAAGRAQLISAFQRGDFTASLVDEAPRLPSNDVDSEGEFRSWFFSQIPPGVEVLGIHFEGKVGTVVTRLSDGQIVVFRLVRDVPSFLS